MDDKLAKLITQHYNELSKKIDDYKEQIDGFKDGVYDRMDSVYKEVLAFRQEQAAHFSNHERTKEELDDLKKRLKKIESPAVTAHSIHK